MGLLLTADEEDNLGGRGGRVGDLRGRGNQGGDPPRVHDLGAAGQRRPRELDPACRVERHEAPVRRSRHQVVAVADGPQPLDWGADRGEGGRRMGGRGRLQLVGRDVRREDENRAFGRSHVCHVRVRVDGDRQGARHGVADDQGARAKVMHLQAVRRRQVQALTPAGHRARAGPAGFVPARLHRRVADRRAEVGLSDDLVVAEELDAHGHRVLREMGMGVLVDPVRLAVLPVLEELDRRPCVVVGVRVLLARRGPGQEGRPPPRSQVLASAAAVTPTVERTTAELLAEAAERVEHRPQTGLSSKGSVRIA